MSQTETPFCMQNIHSIIRVVTVIFVTLTSNGLTNNIFGEYRLAVCGYSMYLKLCTGCRVGPYNNTHMYKNGTLSTQI